MERLFESEADLRRSNYLFRITDNGGASCDRFTIILCDGDYFGSSCDPFDPLGFFQSGEGIDLQGVADRLETGEERELRWIDLPAAVRRAVLGALGALWGDYFNRGADQGGRRDALKYVHSGGAGLYRTKRGYFVIPQGDVDRKREDDHGPFATFREAVLTALPEPYDLSGPEYHAAVDLWDEAGGPAPLWDCEAEPPHPYDVKAAWVGSDYDFDGRTYIDVGEAHDEAHARELAAAWRDENPHFASRYEMLIGGKADRTFRRLRLAEESVA